MSSPADVLPHLSTTSPMSSPAHTTTDPHKDSWYPYSSGAHFDGNIAMILIFIFCGLACALAINTAIRFFQRHSRNQGTQQGPSKLGLQSSASILHTLPTLVYSSGTKMKLAGVGAGGEAAECAICLSEFVDGDSVRIVPKCKHGFHAMCIQGWLSSHVSCPTCRTTCLIPSSDKNEHYDVESPPATTDVAPGQLQMVERPSSVRQAESTSD